MIIVSASRRTDIPAFYTRWLLGRLKTGVVATLNPFNPRQVKWVELKPEGVGAIVFWSKNPRPLMAHLPRLEEAGWRFYFHFTLNPYPQLFEPFLPPLAERISTFQELARMLGSARVIWRYDPIIISSLTPSEFHFKYFTMISEELEGYTQRVIVSPLSFYRKTVRRMGKLPGLVLREEDHRGAVFEELLAWMARRARAAGMEIFSCATAQDYSHLGVSPGRCIDPELIHRLWGVRVEETKHRGQRPACRCAPSVDIGATDSCLHGCRYCYSTTSHAAARAGHARHRPWFTALLKDEPLAGLTGKWAGSISVGNAGVAQR